MTQQELAKDIEATASSLREQGYKIVINTMIPTIAIDWPDSDRGWFCQGEEAGDFLKQVPDYVNDEDYLLWVLDSVGALGG